MQEQLRLQNLQDNYKLLENVNGTDVCQMIANTI